MIWMTLEILILLWIAAGDCRHYRIGKIPTALLFFAGAMEHGICSWMVGGMILCSLMPEAVNIAVSGMKGLGGGDIRLMGAAGWLLGMEDGLYAILLGCLFAVTAAIFGAMYEIVRDGMCGSFFQKRLAFGMYLSAGMIILLLMNGLL